MRNARSFFSIISAAVIFGAFALGSTACGNGSTGGSGGGGDVSFSTDVLPIFRTSCGLSSSCHGEETPPTPAQHYYGPALADAAPTAMQIGEIFTQAVGVKSVDDPDMDVIKPGDSAHSFLIFKLEGDPTKASLDDASLTCAADMSCGTSMPQGGPMLAADQIATIKNWIDQGAKNN
jgi:hypothetical protein